MLSLILGGDCSLVAGLSVTLTFVLTAIFSSLVASLVTMFVCVHERKTKGTPPDPVCLYDAPFSGGNQKEALNTTTNVAYGHVQPQSIPEIGDTYENVAL